MPVAVAQSQRLNTHCPAHRGLTRGTIFHGISVTVPCWCTPILLHGLFGVNGRIFRLLLEFPTVFSSAVAPREGRETINSGKGMFVDPGGGLVRAMLKSMLHLSGLRIRVNACPLFGEYPLERSPHGPDEVLGLWLNHPLFGEACSPEAKNHSDRFRARVPSASSISRVHRFSKLHWIQHHTRLHEKAEECARTF